MGVLGHRSKWTYISDTGHIYAMTKRDADMNAVGNAPAADGLPSLPRNLKPRYVNFETTDGLGKRRIAIGEPSNSYYQSGGGMSVDGDIYVAKGRVGEKDRGNLTD